jgi:hypothetical protein
VLEALAVGGRDAGGSVQGEVRYLDGGDPTYPEAALDAALESLRAKVAGFRADGKSPDATMSDDMNHWNPATVDALIQLTTGGLPTGREVHALHCRLRYFDPERRRAGLPPGVAALVERFSESEVTVQLVNTDPVHPRTVIVQGGAYNEHRLDTVRLEPLATGDAGPMQSTGGAPFAVCLAPGAGSRLRVTMQRFAALPTFARPWV